MSWLPFLLGICEGLSPALTLDLRWRYVSLAAVLESVKASPVSAPVRYVWNCGESCGQSPQTEATESQPGKVGPVQEFEKNVKDADGWFEFALLA